MTIGKSADAAQAWPPSVSAASLADHPSFPEAARCLIDGLATLYGSNFRLVRGLVEYDRAVTFMVLVCLDAEQRRDPSVRQATRARLVEALATMRITNVRRINAIVTALIQAGLLSSGPALDGRARLLRATEEMRRVDREWLKVFHAPLALLYPDVPAYGPVMALDPAYQQAYRLASLQTLDIASGIISENPPIDYFIHEEVGMRMLAILFQEVGEGGATTGGFFTRAAALCGVSRTHVRNVMRGAAERGLVAFSPGVGGGIAILPALREAMRRWIAESLAATDLVCAIAWREYPARGAPDQCGFQLITR